VEPSERRHPTAMERCPVCASALASRTDQSSTAFNVVPSMHARVFGAVLSSLECAAAANPPAQTNPALTNPALTALLAWKHERLSGSPAPPGTAAPPTLPLFSVPVDSGLLSTVRAMFAPGNSGSVLVTSPAASAGGGNGDAAVAGLLSEKGYVSALTHGSAPPPNVTAGQLVQPGGLTLAHPGTPVLRWVPAIAGAPRPATMSPHPPYTSSPPTRSVLAAMLAHGQRHIIVAHSDAAARLRDAGASTPLQLRHVAGIVSMRDVVTFLLHSLGTGAETNAAEARGDGVIAPTLHSDAGSQLAWMRARGQRVVLNARASDNITVATAANAMATKGMSCVAVVDDAGALAGVFTARDFLTRIVLPGLDATQVPVTTVMTKSDIHTVTPDKPLAKVARIMAKHLVRHVPVIAGGGGGAGGDGGSSNSATSAGGDSGAVLGMLSMADVARAGLATWAPTLASDTPAAAAAATNSSDSAPTAGTLRWI